MIKQLVFYCLLATLGFVLLYPKFPLLAIAGTYVPIRVEDLLIAALLLVSFLVNLKEFKKILRPARVLVSYHNFRRTPRNLAAIARWLTRCGGDAIKIATPQTLTLRKKKALSAGPEYLRTCRFVLNVV